ncbi:hypothetical protein PO878_10105 [Iamia majanohamensis]|uniref:Glycosyltransferase RgtA/B/C/D-like domain-containing protein n=1 Tax=Iamia majanohamensis TaxID=467976 RepID=A0AAE9YD95_9ACTN|nr:hypothetical protein [Iamia majanohamensis]WCO69078.1 hypothetical protein PO878_10105 [Iamia majanohamensis]
MVDAAIAPPTRPAPADPRDRAAARSDLRIALPPVVLVVAASVVGALRRPVWLDEAYTVAATHDVGMAFAAARGSMALYYVFAAAWGQVVDSLLWLRAPSVLAGAAAVGIFTVAVRRQAGEAVARWAGLGVAVSYLVVRYAQEARSYALVALLVVGAWAALDRGVEDPAGQTPWRLHLLCCALLPLAHGMAALQLPMQALALLVGGVRGPALRRGLLDIGAGLVSTVAVLAMGANGSGDWLPPLTPDRAWALLSTFIVPFPALGAAVLLTTLVASWALARRVARAGRGLDRFRLVVPLAWGPLSLALLLAVSTVRPSQLSRYALPSIFGLVLVLALATTAVDRRRAQAADATLPIASLAMVVVLGLGGLAATTDAGEPWPEAARVVAEGARPGDVIAFPTADARLPFDAAWRELDAPTAPGVVGVPTELGSVRREVEPAPVDVLASEVGTAPRLWVVVQPYMHVTNPDLVARPEVRAAYRSEQTWDLGDGITVELLVLR